MANIDWAAVSLRYAQAVHAASDGLGVNHEALATAVLLDVRRAGVFAGADTLLPGAAWRDPAELATWMPELPKDREIVVYCVYGHEVCQGTALRLRAEGYNARFLKGGIDAWAAQGRPLQPKGEQR
jgi:Fe-Mn family superoxide dismutase